MATQSDFISQGRLFTFTPVPTYWLMELLTLNPLYVMLAAVGYSALTIPYMVLFIRAIRLKEVDRLRRFTGFTMVLGATLPILHFMLLLLGVNIFPLEITELSPIPADRFHGYIQHLPFFFFTISAILLLHPKAPHYARQVELTWGVVLFINLALFILFAYRLITWTPAPPPPPLDPQHLEGGHIDPAEILRQHVLHPTRERLVLSLILPALWTIISATTLYKAFIGRRRRRAATSGGV